MKDKKFTQLERIKALEQRLDAEENTIGMIWTILKQLAKKIEELVNSIKEDKAKACECK